jgi:hypothetical protein
VFILSPEATASDVCQKEVAFAVSLNKRLAPIVHRAVEDAAIPEPLRRLNFIRFDEGAEFEQSGCHIRCDQPWPSEVDWQRRLLCDGYVSISVPE